MRGGCAKDTIKPRTSKYASKGILGTKNNNDKGREVGDSLRKSAHGWSSGYLWKGWVTYYYYLLLVLM